MPMCLNEENCSVTKLFNENNLPQMAKLTRDLYYENNLTTKWFPAVTIYMYEGRLISSHMAIISSAHKVSLRYNRSFIFKDLLPNRLVKQSQISFGGSMGRVNKSLYK